MIKNNINKPFLKWAGSKRKIMATLKEYIEPVTGSFIEPFVGSGTVFLNVSADKYVLADWNYDLINMFRILQHRGKDFIDYARDTFFIDGTNEEEKFYVYRKQFNSTKDLEEKAALFIYLNRHSYNGLCRYNLSGGFNVPFGRYKTVYFPEKELFYFAEQAAKCQFLFQDFKNTMALAVKGDTIYCDPPYAPISVTSNFTGYCAGGFHLNDQKDLAILAELSEARVIVSNNYTEYTCELYKNATELIELDVQKSIGSKGGSRKKTKEILAIFN